MKTTHEQMMVTMTEIENVARAAGAGVFFPRNVYGYIGHADFYASKETGKTVGAMLKCLAAIGTSRDAWREVETACGMIRRASLRDIDGTLIGEVIVNADGSGTANISYALTSPPACLAA